MGRAIDGLVARAFTRIDETRELREECYRDLHRHPELAFTEHRTAQIVRDALARCGFAVVELGPTGTAGVLRRGAGPVVAARADIDGLPVTEATGLDYASHDTQINPRTGLESPVMHACGHDLHTTALLGAADALAALDSWAGTFVAIFQPAEEVNRGALSLVENGLVDRVPCPEVVIGQHVWGTIPAGCVALRAGATMSASTSIEIELPGPDAPLMAATLVQHLQTIVARRIDPSRRAVLSVGRLDAEATGSLLVNARAFDADTMSRLTEATRSMALAVGASVRCFDQAPVTQNDPGTTRRIARAFERAFPGEVVDFAPTSASEDFSIIPTAFGVPSTYWGLGGFPDCSRAPANHAATFAPAIRPTLDRGSQALVVAALDWLTEELDESGSDLARV